MAGILADGLRVALYISSVLLLRLRRNVLFLLDILLLLLLLLLLKLSNSGR